MFLDTIPASWIITAAILSVSVSSLIRPVGQRKFSKSLTQNLLRFSPFVSGLSAFQATLTFINWRLSGITDTFAACYALGRLYFDAQTPGKKQLPDPTSWESIGRRGLLVAVTVPCYVMLMLRDSYWPLKAAATCFILEAIYVEIFLSAIARSTEGIVLRRDWPAQTFMGKENAEGQGLPMHHSQDGATTANEQGMVDNSGGPQPDSSARLNQHNLCESVQHFWTTSPGLNPHDSTTAWSTHHESGVVTVLSHFPRSWTCSHYRCLTYRVMCMMNVFAVKHWNIPELLAIGWLMHVDMRPFMLRFAGFMLSNRGSSYVFQVLFFTFVNCVMLSLFAAMCYRVFERVPTCKSRGQWCLASRSLRIAVLAMSIASWFVVYVMYLRPILMKEIVLSYLLEVTVFPLVILSADAVVGLGLRLGRRRQRLQASGLGESTTAVAEEIEQPKSDTEADNASDERLGSSDEPRCHDSGKAPA